MCRILKVRRRSSQDISAGDMKEGDADSTQEKKTANPFASVSFAAKSDKVVTIDTSHNGDVEDKKEATASVSKSTSNTNLSISIPSPNNAAQGQSSIDKLPAHLKGYISPKPPSTPGSLTPGGQNRHNPFSSISPKTNPFVVQHDKNPIWADVDKDKDNEKEGVGDTVATGDIVKEKKEAVAVHSDSTTTSSNSTAITAPAEAVTAKDTLSTAPVSTDFNNPFANVKNPFAKNASTINNGLAFGKNAGKETDIFGTGKGLLATKGSGNGGSVGVFGGNKGAMGAVPAFLSAQSNRNKASSLSVFGTSSSSTAIAASTDALLDGEKESSTSTGHVDIARRESGASTASSQDSLEEEEDEEERVSGVMPSSHKIYSMPGGPIVTGEEDECCMLKGRAKLYKLRAKLRECDEHALQQSSSDNKNDKPIKEVMEWTEMGVGPLKILRQKTSAEKSQLASSPNLSPIELRDVGVRLVMRREAKKGGPGTTVILNVPLKEYCSISKQSDSDKALIFTTFVLEEDKQEKQITSSTSTSEDDIGGAEPKGKTIPVQMSYLFKCKSPSETNELLQVIQTVIAAKK